jgi:hypothetical protein
MQPDDVLDLLASGHGFAKTHLSIVTCTAPVAESAEIERLIAEFPNTQGWIARQSGVVMKPGADPEELGAVLEAEIGNATKTLQVRRLGAEWVWTCLIENGKDGFLCLAQDQCLVTTENKSARYRRYWALPENGAVEVVACRLVGLEELT